MSETENNPLEIPKPEKKQVSRAEQRAIQLYDDFLVFSGNNPGENVSGNTIFNRGLLFEIFFLDLPKGDSSILAKYIMDEIVTELKKPRYMDTLIFHDQNIQVYRLVRNLYNQKFRVGGKLTWTEDNYKLAILIKSLCEAGYIEESFTKACEVLDIAFPECNLPGSGKQAINSFKNSEPTLNNKIEILEDFYFNISAKSNEILKGKTIDKKEKK